MDRVGQLGDRPPARRREVALDVVDGARQHVQLVVQFVELLACDHELALAQLELAGPLMRDPVPLTATC